ncbi:MAG: hypothetical protein LBU72_08360 [Burkholderiaceae bacterium]|jgi:hypothetical protein|nr:hypothetical protein [Burkholderiaceae bacterium]
MATKVELEIDGRLKVNQSDLNAAKQSLKSTFGGNNTGWQQFQKEHEWAARRLRATGQQGVPIDKFDEDRFFSSVSAATRERNLRQAAQWNAKYGNPAGPGAGLGAWARSMAGSAMHNGLHAAGPAGAAASGAISAGWSVGKSAGVGAGVGAGIGSLVASGVSAIIGAVANKVGQAQENMLGYDALKRTLGDVGVSFKTLQTIVEGTGKGLDLTYKNAIELTSQYVKSGNVSGGAMNSLPEQIGVGVGLSRAFGLDPSQGVGFLGQMRGVGATGGSVQETRKMALLIGETIGKSDAFAKSGEVLEAVGNFATQQTRQGMSQANVEGYTGAFSAMVSSKIPGLDPSGAANVLARMNAAITAGGAAGEASQFFSARTANSLGIDPLDMEVMQSGGAWATKRTMLGEDSVYRRYMESQGLDLPNLPNDGTLDVTLMEAKRRQLEADMPGGTEEALKMRASAFGRDNNLNIMQAMAWLSLKPNEMGELAKYAADNKLNLSDSGINNMAQAMFGDTKTRQDLAQALLGRKDVTDQDKNAIRDTEKNGFDSEGMKDLLAKLAGKYGQADTPGTNARAMRSALENIQTDVANFIVPGINALAWGKGKTPEEIRKEIGKSHVSEDHHAVAQTLYAERDELKKKLKSGEITQDQYNEKLADIKKRAKENNDESKNKLNIINAGGDPYEPGNLPLSASAGGTPEPSKGNGSKLPQNGAHSGSAMPSAAGKLPRNFRNNNPGNLNYAGQPGAVKESGPGGRFAVFSSAELGLRAMSKQIQLHGSRGLNTVQSLITTWAPPKDHNNTGAYIASVAREMGVSPTKPLDMSSPDTLSKLMPAMIKVESGGKNPYSQQMIADAAAFKRGTPLPPDAMKSNQAPGQGGQPIFQGKGEANIEVNLKQQGQQLAPPQNIKVALAKPQPNLCLR